MKESNPTTVQDLGLSPEEMHTIMNGARVAFGSPDEYANQYPAGALSDVTPPRQATKQHSKVKKNVPTT